MKLFLTSVVAIFAIGCGDATGPGAGVDGGADGGVTPSASCRPPAGCSGYLSTDGLCAYACTACAVLPDGGVINAHRIRPEQIPAQGLYEARTNSDPMNCGDCGRVCPTAQRTCSNGVCR